MEIATVKAEVEWCMMNDVMFLRFNGSCWYKKEDDYLSKLPELHTIGLEMHYQETKRKECLEGLL